ncbi:fumarylacetoacetate hydrolase family protein [Microbacterium dauci]|uniref:Fumarylacetoacetate hydrolase family protein n=1 Tax=Microbacterium dauci TaxID=3048008 RepID=A0ABT6ZC56_9MICO|nr:fumarylacetoacetate hydrolase family protein [Microbacterium sp. LX3-4]MDJ1113581.1 fumarylacetoacetate hydrolase family protein [Microbacterium sp. LX3-4]
MRIVRYSRQESIRYGIVDEKEVVELAGDPLFAGFETTGERIPLAEITLLAPSIPRSKIIGIGKNYRDHAAEMGGEAPAEPLMFLKPNTSVVGPNDAIVRPTQSSRTDYEGELAVVIGRVAKNVPAEQALEYVFGYTIANDVTARDLQSSDGQWARAKGFDTFCPLGPSIETEFDLDAGARIVTRVNGEVRQDGPISDMVHSVPEIIAHASAAFTLLPGDVLLTGTPAGIGSFDAGDVIEVEITGLGILRNTARNA